MQKNGMYEVFGSSEYTTQETHGISILLFERFKLNNYGDYYCRY